MLGRQHEQDPGGRSRAPSGVAAVSVGSSDIRPDWQQRSQALGPVQPYALKEVPGFESGVKAVDASSECALLVAGGVKCVAGTADLSSLGGDIKAISGFAPSASFVHACVITATGGVKCWGTNLGNGTTVSSTTPVDAVGLSGGVRAISSGGDGVCAVTADHALMCWGSSTYTSIPVNTIPTLFPGL